MQSAIQRRVLTLTLSILHVIMQVVLVLPRDSWAQELDTDPPVIEFKPVAEGVKGDSQVFTATVTDDRSLESVVLHYRTDGESLYQNREMEALGSTAIFTTTIVTDERTDVIQYYIEATDAAGNRTLQGFAFDPVERTLVERATEVAEAPPQVVPGGMSTRSKILYGVLGVVVVGALASAAGGGGGGGESPQVDVTIEVDPLP